MTDRLRGLDTSFEIGRCATDSEVKAFVRTFQPDVVVHTACSYGRQGETCVQMLDTNLRYGLGILQALQEIKKNICFINTGSALNPSVSAYGLSKHQFAQWGYMMATESSGRIQFVNVMLQHMYGPGDDVSKFTAHVLHACRRSDHELKLTAGGQERDFIYIDDVVSAYDTILTQHPRMQAIQNIDVGTGVAPTVRQFVETVHRMTSSRTELQFGALPYRDNEVMRCVADLTLMEQLGWTPSYDLIAGLEKTIQLEFNK